MIAEFCVRSCMRERERGVGCKLLNYANDNDQANSNRFHVL